MLYRHILMFLLKLLYIKKHTVQYGMIFVLIINKPDAERRGIKPAQINFPSSPYSTKP